jgi:hypothetical protein
VPSFEVSFILKRHCRVGEIASPENSSQIALKKTSYERGNRGGKSPVSFVVHPGLAIGGGVPLAETKNAMAKSLRGTIAKSTSSDGQA